MNSFLKYNDVWLVKEYGVESSWTRIYKTKQGVVTWNFHHCRPLIFSKNGKKVMMKEGHESGANLVWYDIKKKRGKRIEIQNLPSDFSTAVCIGSLLLLDDGDTVAAEER